MVFGPDTEPPAHPAPTSLDAVRPLDLRPAVRYSREGGVSPENLRILRARGDSMEPLVGEGDRLIVDVSRRAPATGELAALWDGLGLVIKRVEAVSGGNPASFV